MRRKVLCGSQFCVPHFLHRGLCPLLTLFCPADARQKSLSPPQGKAAEAFGLPLLWSQGTWLHLGPSDRSLLSLWREG